MDDSGGRMESVLQGGQLGNSTVVLGLNDVLESKVQKIDIYRTDPDACVFVKNG